MSDTAFFAETAEQLKQYVNDRVLLVKLQATEKVSKVSAGIISGVLMVIFGFFVLLFLGMTIGFALGAWMDSNALGFGLVTVLFILMLVAAITLKRKVIDSFVINKVLHMLLDKKP